MLITVLSANAGVDRTYEVPNFGVGHYHHPKRFRIAPGGKGVNVARVLQRLGREVVVTGFSGGHTGDQMVAMLKGEGVRTEFVRIAEESRLCINIVDETTHSQTQVDEVGPLVAPSELQLLRREWRRLMRHTTLAVIAGSAPRGVPFDLYAELILVAREHKVPVILDARDQYLADAVKAGPQVVKPNLAELERLAGADLAVPSGVVTAANEVLGHGVNLVLTSLGRRGAIAVTPNGSWWAKNPPIDYISDVGSGDAMVAAFIHASLNREPLDQRLRWAVAAGAANASKLGAAFAGPEDIAPLVPQVTLESLGPSDDAGEPDEHGTEAGATQSVT